MNSYIFPKNFKWGCATASYQIEGAYKDDGRGETIWDRFSHTAGKTYNGENGDIACDHYHRYKEDVDLMKFIGINSYRFSIAWSRIYPEGKGKINQKGLDFYNSLVDKLLENEITPYVTLYHWDLPQVLEDKGGWRNKDVSYYFGEYTEKVVEALSDRVNNWMTLNEPWCIANLGYRDGVHAPGAMESKKVVKQIIHNLLLGHGLSVQAIRQNTKSRCEVGIAMNPEVKFPYTDTKDDYEAAKLAWNNVNSWWFDPLYHGKYPEKIWNVETDTNPEITHDEMSIISNKLDFLGLNIYSGRQIIKDEKFDYKEVEYPKDYPVTEMGWHIAPECLYYSLKIMNDLYRLPKYYITENGAAFDDNLSSDKKIHDEQRVNYLKDILTLLLKLMKKE